MTRSYPLVSIITINYNNTPDTLELLKSIERAEIENIEVIVVDNASSTQDDGTHIPELFPWARIVRSERNLGFAGGNNLGVMHAKGDYYFFVNNDTVFEQNIIPHLVYILRDNPSVGMVSPVIHYFEDLRTIQYAGYTPVNKLTGRNRCLTTVSPDNDGLIRTNYAHGAAMMISRATFDIIGCMPEQYFLYYEEFDWCQILKRSGFTIMVDGLSSIMHKESRTVGRISELKSYFMARNRVLFMRRNTTLKSQLIFFIYFLLVVTPKELVRYGLNRQWKNILAHLAGIGWNLSHSIHATTIGYKFNNLNKI